MALVVLSRALQFNCSENMQNKWKKTYEPHHPMSVLAEQLVQTGPLAGALCWGDRPPGRRPSAASVLYLDSHCVQVVLGFVGQVDLLCPSVPHEDLEGEESLWAATQRGRWAAARPEGNAYLGAVAGLGLQLLHRCDLFEEVRLLHPGLGSTALKHSFWIGQDDLKADGKPFVKLKKKRL